MKIQEVDKEESQEARKDKFINKFRFSVSQDNFLLILASIVGILAGIGALIFHESIILIENTFFKDSGVLFGVDSLLNKSNIYISILIVFIPAIGGLLVGLLAHFFEKGEGGEGIPNVIDAVASKGGVIKGSIAIKKIVGSAISIGTGGAGGKEGPIVQIGASIASSFGRKFKLSPDRLKILVGCGGAAGLSAAFNAPLGGALFATEIILRNFRAKTFTPIIIASVFATALSRSFLGNRTAFLLPKYELITNYEFIFYIVLGFIAGLGSVYFVKSFYFIEEFWSKFTKLNKIVKPALGGLVVGLIGLYFPGIYGFSYDAVNAALSNQSSIFLLLALFLIKPIATSMTISSGGNGGTFAPSIFTGAMIGGAFGQIISLLFPELNLQPGSYALVGMAAVVAGTTHASLTAIIMIFELTNDYKIILPLLLTITIASTVSRAILKGDLYSLNFLRRGKEIDIYGRKVSILKKISINPLIKKNYDFVYEHYNFKKVLDTLKKSKFNLILVKNKENEVSGQIAFSDIRDTLLDEESRSIQEFIVAKDIMTQNMINLEMDMNGEDALSVLESVDLEYLPVKNHENKTIGILSRSELLNKYQKEVFLQQSKLEYTTD